MSGCPPVRSVRYLIFIFTYKLLQSTCHRAPSLLLSVQPVLSSARTPTLKSLYLSSHVLLLYDHLTQFISVPDYATQARLLKLEELLEYVAYLLLLLSVAMWSDSVRYLPHSGISAGSSGSR